MAEDQIQPTFREKYESRLTVEPSSVDVESRLVTTAQVVSKALLPVPLTSLDIASALQGSTTLEKALINFGTAARESGLALSATAAMQGNERAASAGLALAFVGQAGALAGEYSLARRARAQGIEYSDREHPNIRAVGEATRAAVRVMLPSAFSAPTMSGSGSATLREAGTAIEIVAPALVYQLTQSPEWAVLAYGGAKSATLGVEVVDKAIVAGKLLKEDMVVKFTQTVDKVKTRFGRQPAAQANNGNDPLTPEDRAVYKSIDPSQIAPEFIDARPPQEWARLHDERNRAEGNRLAAERRQLDDQFEIWIAANKQDLTPEQLSRAVNAYQRSYEVPKDILEAVQKKQRDEKAEERYHDAKTYDRRREFLARDAIAEGRKEEAAEIMAGRQEQSINVLPVPNPTYEREVDMDYNPALSRRGQVGYSDRAGLPVEPINVREGQVNTEYLKGAEEPTYQPRRELISADQDAVVPQPQPLSLVYARPSENVAFNASQQLRNIDASQPPVGSNVDSAAPLQTDTQESSRPNLIDRFKSWLSEYVRTGNEVNEASQLVESTPNVLPVQTEPNIQDAGITDTAPATRVADTSGRDQQRESIFTRPGVVTSSQGAVLSQDTINASVGATRGGTFNATDHLKRVEAARVQPEVDQGYLEGWNSVDFSIWWERAATKLSYQELQEAETAFRERGKVPDSLYRKALPKDTDLQESSNSPLLSEPDGDYDYHPDLIK